MRLESEAASHKSRGDGGHASLPAPYFPSCILPDRRWAPALASSLSLAGPSRVQFFPTLSSISILLGEAVAAASAWAHLLAINLMCARRVVLDAAERGLPAAAARLAVLAAAVAGPVAILVHAAAHAVAGKAATGATRAA